MRNYFGIFVLVTCVWAAAGLAEPAEKAEKKSKWKGDKVESKFERKIERDNRVMRFQGMDRNGDGVITRREWRGRASSFAEHDWNGDGILSGDEVRPGARRPDDLFSGRRFRP